MARLVVVVFSALLAAAPVRAQSSAAGPEEFERLFARAVELHQAGDLLGAIDNYNTALTIIPDRADALSNLGAAYVRLGQYDDGIKKYEAALAVEPANNSIRLNLALAYYKSARPNEAIPQLKRVLASEPEARNAYLVLAECYLQTGQDQEVVMLLKPREQMFENDLAFVYLLGSALLYSGKTEEGQKYIDRIFGSGDSAEARLLMAVALLAQRDYPAAKTELERALKLNPRLSTVNSLYGRALLGVGEQEAAERALRRELDLNVNDFEANLQLGNIRKSAQKFDEASKYLERATTIRPKDLTARRLLASLRLQTGRTEEAVEMLEAIAAEAPDLVEVHVQLATGYTRLKRREDAERERAIVDRLNKEAQAKQPGAKGGTDR